MSLGRRIKVKTIEHGITLRDLFREAGVPEDRGYKIVEGFQRPDPDFEVAILKAFDRIEKRQREETATCQ